MNRFYPVCVVQADRMVLDGLIQIVCLVAWMKRFSFLFASLDGMVQDGTRFCLVE
jgi:hypothetical protein